MLTEAIFITLGVVGFIIFIVCLMLAVLMIMSRNRISYCNHVQSQSTPPDPDKFTITRKQIIDFAQSQDPDHISARVPEGPQHLYTIRWKAATLAMLHGTDKGVLMIVRISDKDKEALAKVHNVQVAKFPRGENWFTVPIDCSFTSKEQVFAIVLKAIEFVKERTAKKSN